MGSPRVASPCSDREASRTTGSRKTPGTWSAGLPRPHPAVRSQTSSFGTISRELMPRFRVSLSGENRSGKETRHWHVSRFHGAPIASRRSKVLCFRIELRSLLPRDGEGWGPAHHLFAWHVCRQIPPPTQSSAPAHSVAGNGCGVGQLLHATHWYSDHGSIEYQPVVHDSLKVEASEASTFEPNRLDEQYEA